MPEAATTKCSAPIGRPRAVVRYACAAVTATFLAALTAGAAFGSEAGARERIGVTDAAVGGALEAVLFYLVAGGAVVSALGVCIAKNIVRMAVWLFIALGSVSMLYFMLAANFLGAIQLIVYAGGTLVLLVFGIMLTSKSPWVKFDARPWELIAAAVVCGVLLVCLCVVLTGADWHGTPHVVPGTPVAAYGRRLLTHYLVPFEVAGVMLMIVMVGAAHLARQES
jgi:NADH:ubiquinone oxidoreductase subunit 6 (subunit J)